MRVFFLASLHNATGKNSWTSLIHPTIQYNTQYPHIVDSVGDLFVWKLSKYIVAIYSITIHSVLGPQYYLVVDVSLPLKKWPLFLLLVTDSHAVVS